MKNPFVYGATVTGDDFANREKEIKELVQDLKDGERVFLISPRKYGKTSLIMNVLEKIKVAGLYTIYIDLYKATSLNKFIEIYAGEIANAMESKLDRVIKLLRDILPTLRPKITIGHNGRPIIGIEYTPIKKDILRFLDEICNLPEQIANKKRKKIVIAFDEFQEIRNFDGEDIEKIMRANFQHHKRVGYLFAGSKKHILYDMVSNKSRAFYKMGRILNLGKIPRGEFKEFLEQKFLKTGFILKPGVIDKVLDIVDNYPYNAQFLCHKLWDLYFDTKKINTENVQPTLERIIIEETPFYLTIWDSLPLTQRQILKAIAMHGGKRIYSQEFIKMNDLGALSTVQTSIRLLIKKEILDKVDNIYYFSDVFFREWVRLRI